MQIHLGGLLEWFIETLTHLKRFNQNSVFLQDAYSTLALFEAIFFEGKEKGGALWAAFKHFFKYLFLFSRLTQQINTNFTIRK